MSLFDPYHDNLLAVEDYDTEGDHISISYRFTVHISDGDPIVIWSDPSQAKFLHLAKEQPDPEGWTREQFRRFQLAAGRGGTELNFPSYASKPAGLGLWQPSAVEWCPTCRTNSQSHDNTEDHDLLPEPFPASPTTRPRSGPGEPVLGSARSELAVQPFPGPDSAEFSQFNILAWLPKGLEPGQRPPGYKWVPSMRRLSWSYDRDDLQVGYATCPPRSVISASGWSQPDRRPWGRSRPAKRGGN